MRPKPRHTLRFHDWADMRVSSLLPASPRLNKASIALRGGENESLVNGEERIGSTKPGSKIAASQPDNRDGWRSSLGSEDHISDDEKDSGTSNCVKHALIF